MIRVISLLLAMAVCSGAQAGRIAVSPDKSTIANPFTVRILAELKPGESATFPEKLGLPDAMEQLSRRIDAPVKLDNGAVLHSASYQVESYMVGKAEIPAQEFVVTGADGQQSVRKAEPATFEIVSVRVDKAQAEKVKHVDTPAATRLRYEKYILPLLLALVAAVLAYLIFRWLRARRRNISEPAPAPRPADEIALEKLSRLKARNLCSKGRCQEHFFLVSEIIREYLENRYGVMALERTTYELKSQFTDDIVDNETRRRLFKVLEACDMVKFARFKPTAAHAEESISMAVEWVEMTSEKPVEAEEGA